MEQLNHQTSEALEGTWDSDSWRHLDQHTFGGMDVDLQPSCLIDGRVEEREEALCQ
jgi:hypothetical protein